jgi:hypothetical protein
VSGVEIHTNGGDTDSAGIVDCPRCSRKGVPQAKYRPGICVDCYRAEKNRDALQRRQNKDWVALARESGLNLWDQQPDETQLEYTIWSIYRDSYPGRRLTYGEVAQKAGCSLSAVKAAAARWNFAMRMQEWIRYCNEITLIQRRQEMLDMNKEHIEMAKRLRNKLSDAINSIDPRGLKPSELSSLLKVMNELERQARIDEIAQQEMIQELSQGPDENPELRKSLTKKEELSDVIAILLKAGALDGVQMGVRQVKTETTEVVMGGENRSVRGVVVDATPSNDKK